jgi:hypothetical protein
MLYDTFASLVHFNFNFNFMLPWCKFDLSVLSQRASLVSLCWLYSFMLYDTFASLVHFNFNFMLLWCKLDLSVLFFFFLIPGLKYANINIHILLTQLLILRKFHYIKHTITTFKNKNRTFLVLMDLY